MNTVKSFLILCAVSSLLLSASCGSIDKSVSKPEINTQAAETIIAKRHAQSMLDAWRAGDRAEAAKEIKVLQSLLDIDAKQLPQRVHQLLPEPSLDEINKIVEVCANFVAKPLDAEDEEGVKSSAEDLPGAVSAVPVALSHEDRIRTELKKILVEFGESENFQVPDDFFNRVKIWIDVFTRQDKNRDWFERALRRMEKYYPMVAGVFEKRSLPEALYFMAFIESGFNPYARSRVGAVGLWQFMPSTGKRYGLKVGRRIDQRKDPKRATEAAREYILDLILEFGDGHSVLLAMASYNAGENRIRGRLRRLDDFRDRSFWALAEKNLLPAETRDYVPKILAAAVIVRNKTLFGFDGATPFMQYASITLKQPVSVPLLAQLSGMTLDTFVKVNPDIEPGQLVTAEDVEVVINVPKDRLADVENNHVIKKARLAAVEEPSTSELEIAGNDSTPLGDDSVRLKDPDLIKVNSEPRTNELYIVYNAKRGNSLEEIAGWFSTDVNTIKENNPFLKTRDIKEGDQLYLYSIPRDLKTHFYRVESKDTLYDIAELYSVSPALISSWNDLRMSSPSEGKLLVVYSGGGIKPWSPKNFVADDTANESDKVEPIKSAGKNTTGKKTGGKSDKRASFVYTVRYRNTLAGIASAFNVSPGKIKKANNLRSTRIHHGQKLLIPRNGVRKLTYRVRSGDTLQRIAAKYRTTIRALQTFNGLRGSRIVIGERLVIYAIG